MVKLNPEELIFAPVVYDGGSFGYDCRGNYSSSPPRQSWSYMPLHPKRGTVVCYDVDRCMPWNIFVVIESDEKTLKVIYPRIRVTYKDGDDTRDAMEANDPKNWKIELGQDKTSEKRLLGEKCKCPPACQGDDGFCRCGLSTLRSNPCGAYDNNRDEYHETFEPVEDGEYEIHVIENINTTRDSCYTPWLEHVLLKNVNELDNQHGF
jgi:hypothetical protein